MVDLNFFNSLKGRFCFLSNLQTYINFQGLPCTESVLGAVIGYLGFYYTDKKVDSGEVILGRNGSFEDMFDRLQNQLAEQLQEDRLQAQDCLEYIDMQLKGNKPPLVWINDYYLSYSPYYNKAEYWSLIIVLDISESGITVYDNEVRQVDKQAFMRAINQEGRLRAYNPKHGSPIWKSSEATAIISGLTKAAELFDGGPSDGDGLYGFKGMTHFAEALAQCNSSSEIYNYSYQMNRASGPTVTREYMSILCIELMKSYSSLDLEKCAALYQNLSEQWRKIGNLLFKLSTNLDKDLRVRLVERIHKAIALEMQGVLLIKSDVIRQLELYAL